MSVPAAFLAALTLAGERQLFARQLKALDAAGLDAMDRRYLTTIAMNYGGGPVAKPDVERGEAVTEARAAFVEDEAGAQRRGE